MRGFLVRTILFLIPIVLVITYVLINYNHTAGDLGRMSYLSYKYDYSSVFEEKKENEHIVISVSDSLPKRKWKFFMLGDSFFQQRRIGIVNRLSHAYPEDVLYYNRNLLIGDNVFLTLQGLINSDFFDSLDVEYLVLGRVERYLLQDVDNLNDDLFISWTDIQNQIEVNHQPALNRKESKEPYPTDRFVKFPINNLFYQFRPNGLNKEVYQEKLSKPLFSTKTQDLLFYVEELDSSHKRNFSLNNKLSITNIGFSN